MLQTKDTKEGINYKDRSLNTFTKMLFNSTANFLLWGVWFQTNYPKEPLVLPKLRVFSLSKSSKPFVR